MSAGKYHNVRRNKEQNKNNNEVIGIVLVAISAFILLCTIIPPVLGPISSKGVFPVFIGLFGVFSYPLFLCTLILGIALIRGIQPELPARQKAGITIMAVSLMLILQMATTHNRLGDFNGYGEYLKTVFMGGWASPKIITAGGALFGIVAYALSALITKVAAYIICSVFFLAALGYFFIWPIFAARKNAGEKATANKGAFEKGSDAYPREFMPVTDNTLFVDRIIPQSGAGYGTDASMGQNGIQGGYQSSKNQPFQQIERPPEFDPYHSPNPSNDSVRTSARQILFGGANESSQPAEKPRTTYDEARESFWAEHSLRPLSAEPTVKDTTSAPPASTLYQQRPPKRVHDDVRAAFGDVSLPPPNDISDKIVGTEGIINGDDYSVKLAEENAARNKTANIDDRPQIGEFNSRSVEISKAEYREPEAKPSTIVNGDYFGAPIGEIRPQENLREARKVDFTVPQNEIEEQPFDEFEEEKTDSERPPIIAASEYANNQNEQRGQSKDSQKAEESSLSAETRFQMLLEEERKRHEAAEREKNRPEPQQEQNTDTLTYNYDLPDETYEDDYDVSTYDKILDRLDEATNDEIEHLILDNDDIPMQPNDSLSSETAESTEESNSEPERNATEDENVLRMIDDTIDLSEQSHFEGTDNTGYYEEVTEAPKKAERPKEKRTGGEQVRIDDYLGDNTELPKPKKKKRIKYNAPSIEMLTPASRNSQLIEAATEDRARILEEALHTFKLNAKVTGIVVGPAVTRYELEMPPGVSVKRIEQMSQDLAYSLGCNGNIRVEAPVRGKKAVGVEVPNDSVEIVRLREVLESKEFKSASSPLTLAIGRDITGNVIVCNLEKMPHLLIAGATNSGKSACLNAIIMSIIYKSSPEDVRLILIDPKLVEFALYDQIPHLLGDGIINDTQQAINALTWAREEMERRYHAFSALKVKNIGEYNKCEAVKNGQADKMQYIVLIVDEFAELTIDTENRKALENRVVSMAQKARAAGIHLILATQRPSADVITGTIRANLPSCIAFAVRSYTDSRIILDAGGAETLLGKGDMLYSPAGADGMLRVQGAYVESDEISAITAFVKENNETDFDEDFTAAIRKTQEVSNSESDEEEKEFDPLMPEVLKCVIESGRASTSMVQSRFSVGYARANRIIDQMEIHKFIGPRESNNFRPVYITREEFKKQFGTDI